MSENSANTGSTPRTSAPQMTIVNGGLHDRGSIVSLLVILLITAVAWSRAGGMGALVAAFVLLAAGWRLWAPVRIDLGPLGVSHQLFGLQRRIPWNALGRIEFLDEGMLLTPEPEQPLAVLRGVFIAHRNRREELETIVRFYVEQRYHRGSISELAERREAVDERVGGFSTTAPGNAPLDGNEERHA